MIPKTRNAIMRPTHTTTIMAVMLPKKKRKKIPLAILQIMKLDVWKCLEELTLLRVSRVEVAFVVALGLAKAERRLLHTVHANFQMRGSGLHLDVDLGLFFFPCCCC